MNQEEEEKQKKIDEKKRLAEEKAKAEKAEKARKKKEAEEKKKKDEELQQEIFDKVESKVQKDIDRQEEKQIIQLQGGGEIDVNLYVSKSHAQKCTHYYKELFYYPLADLFGVPRSVMDDYVKPHFVAVSKHNFILSRFPQRVVDRILADNKYVGFCRREYHHYQLLTPEADAQYKLFIWQVQEMMKVSSSVKDFIIKYSTEYKLPIQLNLFDIFFFE